MAQLWKRPLLKTSVFPPALHPEKARCHPWGEKPSNSQIVGRHWIPKQLPSKYSGLNFLAKKVEWSFVWFMLRTVAVASPALPLPQCPPLSQGHSPGFLPSSWFIANDLVSLSDDQLVSWLVNWSIVAKTVSVSLLYSVTVRLKVTHLLLIAVFVCFHAQLPPAWSWRPSKHYVISFKAYYSRLSPCQKL